MHALGRSTKDTACIARARACGAAAGQREDARAAFRRPSRWRPRCQYRPRDPARRSARFRVPRRSTMPAPPADWRARRARPPPSGPATGPRSPVSARSAELDEVAGRERRRGLSRSPASVSRSPAYWRRVSSMRYRVCPPDGSATTSDCFTSRSSRSSTSRLPGRSGAGTTASRGASVQPPRNTARRRNSTRCGSVRSSWLQSTVRAQRLLPGFGGAAPGRQHGEPVLHMVGQLDRRQARQPGRRQLERQRDAVQPAADLGHRLEAAASNGAGRPPPRGPGTAGRPDSRRPARAVSLLAAWRRGATGSCTSPGTARASRLVARIRTRGHRPRTVSTREATARRGARSCPEREQCRGRRGG